MDLDEALADVVARSGDRLLRVAYQPTHDRVAAQDVVQEALLRVYRSVVRRGVAPPDSYAYLRRAVVNEYLRIVRLYSSAEVVTDRMPERPVASSPEDQIADRAQRLRFGAATPPLVFPVRLTGLTSRWRVSDVHYFAGAGVLRADSYILIAGTSRFLPHVGDLGVWTNAPYVDIHPAPGGSTCTPHDPAYKNTSKVINGYQVVVQRGTIGGLAEQDVCAAHASGFWASIEEFGPHPTISVASLFKHLRFPGTNPANWTSNPIG